MRKKFIQTSLFAFVCGFVGMGLMADKGRCAVEFIPPALVNNNDTHYVTFDSANPGCLTRETDDGKIRLRCNAVFRGKGGKASKFTLGLQQQDKGLSCRKKKDKNGTLVRVNCSSYKCTQQWSGTGASGNDYYLSCAKK